MSELRRVDGTRVPDEVLSRRSVHVTVCLPAIDEEESVGATVASCVRARDRGLLDDVIVIDGGSTDGTVAHAEAAGARVLVADQLLPDHGPAAGKGDAMWRSLSVIEDGVVVYLDADLVGDAGMYALGLAGAIVADDAVAFAKGAFHRLGPDGLVRHGDFDGGRVSELVTRPLLNLFRPDLAQFYQPLSGQIAATTDFLRSIPFLTGFAVEIAMLVDAVDRLGWDRIREVAIGDLRNRDRSGEHLARMAQEVLYGFLHRVGDAPTPPVWGSYRRPHYDGGWTEAAPYDIVERPPMEQIA